MSDIDNANKVQIIAESVELNLTRVKTNFINKHYAKMNELAEEGEKKGDSYNLIQQTIISCNSINQQ